MMVQKIRLLTIPLTLLACIAMTQLSARESHGDTPKSIGEIERLDPAFDKLVPIGAEVEVLAEGFDWSEGPLWIKDKGHLLFSDIPRNQIVRWTPKEGISIFMEKSGYTGKEPFTGPEPGSNGLTVDDQGRLVMCCHGDRQIKRLEKDGSLTVLASHYEGKRLNSPNDLIYHKSGALYFTDPPYGLPKRYDDPARELDWCGVYRLDKDGTITLVSKEMTRPNGLTLSPDHKTLYVGQSDPKAAIWKTFAINDDGSLGPGKLFYDVTDWIGRRPGGCDGMCVDVEGNVWATAPGGVWIFSPKGKLLGRLVTGQRTANCTFGDDGSTLYITVDMYLCRVKTLTKGLKN